MDANEKLLCKENFDLEWIPVRAALRQWKTYRAKRLSLADSTGAELTGSQALVRALVLKRLLEKYVLDADEKNVGILLPPSVPCTLVNVALGVGITVLIAKLAHQELTDMAGVYTGAITNTPGLSAAQAAVEDLGIEGGAGRLATGYALAYPLAVVGMIVSCIILRPKNLAAEPTVDAVSASATVAATGKKKGGILLIPIFVIIALGIVLGSIPIPVGMKAPVKLGLAGGPLVVAIVAGWLGVKKGWYGTDFTDGQGVHMLRETGIALFLAAVGLGAGGDFVANVSVHYMWVVYGVIITMVPPLLVAGFGRLVLKMNYYTLMGFIGGSHTDPPTLAFANTVAPEGCKLPNTGYATVYPLTMFLRIFSAQLLVLFA